MRTADFTYDLPDDLIAQSPAPSRDQSRLLVLHRDSCQREHRQFPNLLEYLRAGDLLVLNNTRVIPARLRAFKPGSGGNIEVLLVEKVALNEWWTMLRPGKRVRPGTVLRFRDLRGQETQIEAEVQEKSDDGHYRLRFQWVDDLEKVLDTLGEIPLPPYIERGEAGPTEVDYERYQTVFAQRQGSVAAPTAGLHFTREILEAARARGIETAEVTLHVGLGTFAPVKSETLQDHRMHEEWFEMPAATAEAIRNAKARGGRVIAVGTTSLRVLESVFAQRGKVEPASGRTRLFVYPPYRFGVVDVLLTNFHLPESTLLMLVSAFAAPGETRGRDLILETYAEAVRERYRFFSYGDAMLIL